jgi:hypothetical protein
MEMTKVEYRIRPVTRYVVTRYHEQGDGSRHMGAGCESKGEFDNAETAYAVGYALAKHEHEQLGWPVGDERIAYPAPIEGAQAQTVAVSL